MTVASCYRPCFTVRLGKRSIRLAILTLAVLGPATGFSWTDDVTKDPLTRQERCLLRSEVQTIQDGYGETPVSLVINDEALLVVTESQIDPSFGDLEVVVDDKAPLKTAKVAKDKVLVFDHDRAMLIDQFKAGAWATIYLRFWPTWPATQRFPAKFTLKGFTKAYSDFERCRENR
jgi:hypothetical protein